MNKLRVSTWRRRLRRVSIESFDTERDGQIDVAREKEPEFIPNHLCLNRTSGLREMLSTCCKPWRHDAFSVAQTIGSERLKFSDVKLLCNRQELTEHSSTTKLRAGLASLGFRRLRPPERGDVEALLYNSASFRRFFSGLLA